jgi:hypothetical protein
MSKGKKLTIKEFIEKAKAIHNNKYDYSNVEYVHSQKKIIIICLEHGPFEQRPSAHLQGQGCVICRNRESSTTQQKTLEEFIEQAVEKHGDRYNYSHVSYKRNDIKVDIACPVHGRFKQTPTAHLRGSGCRKCVSDTFSKERMLTNEKFIEKAKSLHGNRYTYNKTTYSGNRKSIIVTCKIHGDFEQIASNHIRGYGCPKCNSSKGEGAIRKFLKKNKINFLEQYSFNECRATGKLYFDFYIPDKNVLIEFDGIHHFEPTRFGGSDNFIASEKFLEQIERFHKR